MEMDLPPPPLQAAADRRHCREYLLALEEERRKIQVFQRELPLCFDLVTQTIEGMRSQMVGVGNEETVSDHGPGLEEFMPLKPGLSLSSSEEQETSHDAATTNGHGKKEEAETPDRRSPLTTETNKVLPCKPLALNARKAGGAFQPFEKRKRTELPASSSTTPAASSAAVGDSCDKAAKDTEEKHSDKEMRTDAKDKGKDEDKEGQSRAPHRKPRRCWSPELHHRFLQASQQLGGSHVATPKQIRELMKVDGLTNDEVKSHLQKYRLHTRRPNSTAQRSNASAAPAAPQFVVVGGIWVPPPEYAAAAAAAAAATQPQVSGSGNTVYAPVAMLPPGLQPHSQQKHGQRQSRTCSDGPQSGDASSASPPVSSSSHTTSA